MFVTQCQSAAVPGHFLKTISLYGEWMQKKTCTASPPGGCPRCCIYCTLQDFFVVVCNYYKRWVPSSLQQGCSRRKRSGGRQDHIDRTKGRRPSRKNIHKSSTNAQKYMPKCEEKRNKMLSLTSLSC